MPNGTASGGTPTAPSTDSSIIKPAQMVVIAVAAAIGGAVGAVVGTLIGG